MQIYDNDFRKYFLSYFSEMKDPRIKRTNCHHFDDIVLIVPNLNKVRDYSQDYISGYPTSKEQQNRTPYAVYQNVWMKVIQVYIAIWGKRCFLCRLQDSYANIKN
jgi:hypothetical protein